LDKLQDEIDALGGVPRLDVSLLGINGIGDESGNASITSGRDIPWLQDVEAYQAWTTWGITYRDVVILDEDNVVVDVYNLTAHSLADTNNYNALRGMLLEAAGVEGAAIVEGAAHRAR
jgi:hypothetical protein